MRTCLADGRSRETSRTPLPKTAFAGDSTARWPGGDGGGKRRRGRGCKKLQVVWGLTRTLSGKVRLGRCPCARGLCLGEASPFPSLAVWLSPPAGFVSASALWLLAFALALSSPGQDLIVKQRFCSASFS